MGCSDGKVISQTYSKATIDAKKKNADQRAKLNDALDAALGAEKGEWKKLLDLLK